MKIMDFNEVFDYPKGISIGRMDFDNPKEFDYPQVFEYPKGISIGRMDFENPKFYGNYLHLRWSCFKEADCQL